MAGHDRSMHPSGDRMVILGESHLRHQGKPQNIASLEALRPRQSVGWGKNGPDESHADEGAKPTSPPPPLLKARGES